MSRRKIMTALLAVILCIGLAGGPIAAQDAQPKDMESILEELLEQGKSENLQQELPLYCFSLENESKIEVVYMDGFDVPNISASDWTDLMNLVDETLQTELAKKEAAEEETAEEEAEQQPLEVVDGLPAADEGQPAEAPAATDQAAEDETPEEPAEPEYELEFSAQDSTATITRKNGSLVIFDNKTTTVEFSDYNVFMQKSEQGYLADFLGNALNSGDEKPVYMKKSSNSYVRKGDKVLIDLASYGIKMYSDEENFFVPMQTLSDLLLAPQGINMYYNGEAVFIAEADAFADEEGLTEMGEAFYSVAPGGYSEDLAGYSYSELCMVLDHYYGLKESHRITDFDKLFEDLGYQKPLKNTNPKISEQTLYRLINYVFDDPVSEFLASSAFAGSEVSYREMIGAGVAAKNRAELEERFGAAREEAFPEGVPAYEEIGNTAFITIDAFRGTQADYFTEAPEEDAKDTIGLLLYAYREITREDSPIENVVLDLSANQGGDLDAAAFAMAFFLGEAAVCMTDSLTGAVAYDIYQIDLNLDRQCNKMDKLPAELNLYCLISPVTAGEGSLAAAAFTDSQLVTMLGQTTGGTYNLAQTLTTAFGTSCQIAGNTRLSIMRNGAFDETDGSVEPDYKINVPAAFYDREALAGFIGSLPFGTAG